MRAEVSSLGYASLRHGSTRMRSSAAHYSPILLGADGTGGTGDFGAHRGPGADNANVRGEV